MNQRACPRPPKRLNIVGPILRQIRESQKVSQQELANQLQRTGWDVDRVVITRIEGGKRMLTDFEIAKLIEALNTSWQEVARRLDEVSIGSKT